MCIRDSRKMNPFCIPFAITNMGSAMLAMDTGLMGPNYSISSACATGNYCMLNAVKHIRAGEADVMLAGATDAAIIPEGALLFCLPCLLGVGGAFVGYLGAVTRRRRHHPRGCMPAPAFCLFPAGFFYLTSSK